MDNGKTQYRIDCVKENIISLESKGKDASFERSLLKSWSKYEGWEEAGVALKSLPSPTREKSDRVKG